MSTVAIATLAASFLASAVEFVEAVTIVLAVGLTRQWRSTLLGVGAALVALAALVGVQTLGHNVLGLFTSFAGAL